MLALRGPDHVGGWARQLPGAAAVPGVRGPALPAARRTAARAGPLSEPGQKVTKVDLAATFGVSRPTIDSWLAQGDPARYSGPWSEDHTCEQA